VCTVVDSEHAHPLIFDFNLVMFWVHFDGVLNCHLGFRSCSFGRFPPAGSEKVDIQLLDLDSKRVSKIPGSENLWQPCWSPDGEHLAAASADSKKLLLFDFKKQQWTDWIWNEQGTVVYPTWSADGTYLYFENFTTATYRRVKLGQTHSELVTNLKDLHRYIGFGAWSGLTPDGSPLFVRDVSTDEIYALDMELP
jgi:WD40 repeat protein